MAHCSWTLLWLIWIALVGVLLFCLRGPLKLIDPIDNASATSYFNNLTPKFYVALTGTSSLVSGIILIFEWWYFKKIYSSSQHVEGVAEDEGSDNEDSVDSSKSIPECKVWRNPMALFRAAEYSRFRKQFRSDALSFYDMNLSAQDHQTIFTCDDDHSKRDYDLMAAAWRECDAPSRIRHAHSALSINPECAPALILLAEEEAETISEAEVLLKKALRSVENLLASYPNGNTQIISYTDRSDMCSRRRNINMQMYIKRRLAMCARKQGRIREAVKMFRDLSRDATVSSLLSVQDNLIEACLEMQAYADVQTLLVRYDTYGAPCAYELREPRSAALSYTSALLKVRPVAENFRCVADISLRRGLSSAEQTAIDALMRAMEFNPHVPQYLLEIRPLIMPPEHFLKRGDSEAITYAFSHIGHWKRIDGSLQLLEIVWKDFISKIESNNYCFPYSPQLESADKELLPVWHKVSVFPRKESTIFSLAQTLGCLFICIGALMVHHYPSSSTQLLHAILMTMVGFYEWLWDSIARWIPDNIISLLASKQGPVNDL